jgi:hypothetical protein
MASLTYPCSSHADASVALFGTMAGMADAARYPLRRPVAIGLVVLAAVMLLTEALALWNPWRLTALYPLAQAGLAVALLVLAGGLLATTALLTFATRGRRALIGLVACLVAIPALCVGLPVVVLDFRRVSTTVLASSPSGDHVIVKQTGGDQVRLLIRTRQFLLGREAAIPVATCDHDPFERGVPPEAVRFTSETTVAIPIADQSTVVVRFNPDTLAPDRTVAMC